MENLLICLNFIVKSNTGQYLFIYFDHKSCTSNIYSCKTIASVVVEMAKTYLEGYDDVVLSSQEQAWAKYMEYLMGGEQRELRVCTWDNPPFVYAQHSHYDNFDNEYFRISGPLYSLIKEAVKKMNTRLIPELFINS